MKNILSTSTGLKSKHGVHASLPWTTPVVTGPSFRHFLWWSYRFLGQRVDWSGETRWWHWKCWSYCLPWQRTKLGCLGLENSNRMTIFCRISYILSRYFFLYLARPRVARHRSYARTPATPSVAGDQTHCPRSNRRPPTAPHRRTRTLKKVSSIGSMSSSSFFHREISVTFVWF